MVGSHSELQDLTGGNHALLMEQVPDRYTWHWESIREVKKAGLAPAFYSQTGE